MLKRCNLQKSAKNFNEKLTLSTNTLRDETTTNLPLTCLVEMEEGSVGDGPTSECK